MPLYPQIRGNYAHRMIGNKVADSDKCKYKIKDVRRLETLRVQERGVD
jgi:hypothetical protein